MLFSFILFISLSVYSAVGIGNNKFPANYLKIGDNMYYKPEEEMSTVSSDQLKELFIHTFLHAYMQDEDEYLNGFVFIYISTLLYVTSSMHTI